MASRWPSRRQGRRHRRSDRGGEPGAGRSCRGIGARPVCHSCSSASCGGPCRAVRGLYPRVLAGQHEVFPSQPDRLGDPQAGVDQELEEAGPVGGLRVAGKPLALFFLLAAIDLGKKQLDLGAGELLRLALVFGIVVVRRGRDADGLGDGAESQAFLVGLGEGIPTRLAGLLHIGLVERSWAARTEWRRASLRSLGISGSYSRGQPILLSSTSGPFRGPRKDARFF